MSDNDHPELFITSKIYLRGTWRYQRVYCAGTTDDLYREVLRRDGWYSCANHVAIGTPGEHYRITPHAAGTARWYRVTRVNDLQLAQLMREKKARIRAAAESRSAG